MDYNNILRSMNIEEFEKICCNGKCDECALHERVIGLKTELNEPVNICDILCILIAYSKED